MAAKYLTMVGQLQWLVTLGRFDIHAQVTTMSRFRAAPRQGHMDRLKGFTPMPLGPRIMQLGLGLNNLTIPSFLIKILTGHTLYMVMSMNSFLMTCQNHLAHEILPDDMPEPLGKAVTTTTTMDANLNHCFATGKSLTGCLHFVNKTAVDWYSKKQATVETATYVSEFVAAKTATEQIMDIRQTISWCTHHYQVLPIW